MTRRHGRSPRGQRVDAAVPHGHRKVVTPTAAVRPGGVGACLAFGGATDAACSEAHVGGRPAPTLEPGDIVLRDNPSRHRTAAVARRIAAAGAEVRRLPAYGPALDPIEATFGELKAILRSAAARAVDALVAAMGDGLRSVTPGDIRGWFDRSGHRDVQ